MQRLRAAHYTCIPAAETCCNTTKHSVWSTGNRAGETLFLLSARISRLLFPLLQTLPLKQSSAVDARLIQTYTWNILTKKERECFASSPVGVIESLQEEEAIDFLFAWRWSTGSAQAVFCFRCNTELKSSKLLHIRAGALLHLLWEV